MNPAISTLVQSAEQGDRAAADTLFTTLYDELHRMARRELATRGAGVTLGGMFEITSLATEVAEVVPDTAELTRISDALDALAGVDAGLALIVDLKFFCGFSFAEIAAMRGVSERTVQRDWEKARIYLHQALNRAFPAA